MAVTNSLSGTNVHEISDGIYRINTPVVFENGRGFSFNQYLVTDDESLLFHTGPRKMFPLVHEAVASIIPVERLCYIGISHVEADECGSLNEWLTAAPHSIPLCSTVAAMVSIEDLADRSPRPLADSEVISLGRHRMRWMMPRICPMHGTVDICQRNRPEHYYAAICLPRVAPTFRPLRNPTSSNQARSCGSDWIIFHTPRIPMRCLNGWLH